MFFLPIILITISIITTIVRTFSEGSPLRLECCAEDAVLGFHGPALRTADGWTPNSLTDGLGLGAGDVGFRV